MEEVRVEIAPTINIQLSGQSLNQNRTSVQYVLLDDEYNNLHDPVFCKDYFNEIFLTQITGKIYTQYGMTTSKFDYPIMDKEMFKLGIILNKGNDPVKFINNVLKVLNEMETYRGFKHTTIEVTTNDLQLVLNSDSKWFSNSIYFSLYTLMIRVAYSYDKHDMPFMEWFAKEFKLVDNANKLGVSDSMTYTTPTYIPYVEYLYKGGEVPMQWLGNEDLPSSTIHNCLGLYSYYGANKEMINELIDKFKNDSNKKTDSVQADDFQQASDTCSIEVEAQAVACAAV